MPTVHATAIKRSSRPWKLKKGQVNLENQKWSGQPCKSERDNVQLTHFPNRHIHPPPSPSWPHWSSSSSRKPSAQDLGAPLLLHRAEDPCWWPSPPPPSPPGRTATWPATDIANILCCYSIRIVWGIVKEKRWKHSNISKALIPVVISFQFLWWSPRRQGRGTF